MLIILYPDSAAVQKGWFSWCMSASITILAVVPNCVSPRTVRFLLRLCAYSTFMLIAMYLIWFPVAASRRKGFQSVEIFTTFYNGINYGVDEEGNTVKEASDSYCWVVGVLFGAWEFYGYDASVHLAEETHEASSVVAKGMWSGTLATWVLSIPILALTILCMQDFQGVVNGGYPNNFAEYCVQLLGRNGACAFLFLIWFDGILCTAVCVLSAQRITFAIARDGILPCSRFLSRVTDRHHLPVNAGVLVAVLSIAINAAVIGSYVAFSALTAAATVGTNLSYLIPIVARQTVGKKNFKPAKWHLGRWSLPVSCVAAGYIMFLFVVLMLPQIYPVTAETLNYCPVVIGSIAIIALGGWFFPFQLGGRYWFAGPKRTISEVEVREARVKRDDQS
ncbi:uncharacterized protein LTR77_000971 [Saxophila tyrrhenica]|uniref:Uncharacterized protein n=1 Tax=Saxophila tyrrhenica TaxID=1690608 RepID=A0AAV9PPT5_9PEZI|nr:hypothetical protein LTR77_000971 [Saxophila tyrrhenica]